MNWALYNLTSTTQSGGVESSVWHIAKALKRLGQKVTVLAGKGQGGPAELSGGVATHTFRFTPRDQFPDLGTRARKLMERLSFARQAMPTLRAAPFTRVLVFKPYDLPPVLWCARKKGFKVGFLSGGAEFFPGYRQLAKRVDYLGAVSAFHADQITRRTGLRPQVNLLGVDSELFHPEPPDETLARRFSLEPGDPVIVSAVRLVPLKGLQDVLTAMTSMDPRVRLLVAGQGPYRQGLMEMAGELGLGQRVAFVGYVPSERLAGFYALGRVAVFASQGEEALGLSAAEAAACGLPVVATKVGGLPEVVGRNSGVLVPPKDPPALAAALTVLLEEPELCQVMGRAGREHSLVRFSWDACAERLLAGMEGR